MLLNPDNALWLLDHHQFTSSGAAARNNPKWRSKELETAGNNPSKCNFYVGPNNILVIKSAPDSSPFFSKFVAFIPNRFKKGTQLRLELNYHGYRNQPREGRYFYFVNSRRGCTDRTGTARKCTRKRGARTNCCSTNVYTQHFRVNESMMIILIENAIFTKRLK